MAWSLFILTSSQGVNGGWGTVNGWSRFTQTAELFIRVLPKGLRGVKRTRGGAECGDGESQRLGGGCGLQPTKRRTNRSESDSSLFFTDIVQKWDPYCGRVIGRSMRSVLQARSDAAEFAFALCVTRMAKAGGLLPAMCTLSGSEVCSSVYEKSENSFGDFSVREMDVFNFGQLCVDYGNVYGAELPSSESAHQRSAQFSRICVESFQSSPLCEVGKGEANDGRVEGSVQADVKGRGVSFYFGTECGQMSDWPWDDSEWVDQLFRPEYMM
jgi:hypothetical protein